MKKIIVLLLISSLSFLSCKNDNEYYGICGVWSVEEYGDLTPYRRYNLSIRSHEAFDSVYVVSNLYRSGNHNETLIEVENLTITITPQVVDNYYIRGSGQIQPDFKKVNLNYHIVNTVAGIEEDVFAVFTRN
ncbi:MAG TPA: hypothetical protein PLY32_05375 [Salinivirgaceae bacterium]|nr:hypothetical protein [Salinivirgaceae bacterium]HQA76531.1 hypothetical protein [Salinivirgaceae bacterium]